ncbi:Fic family protein [Pseudomonas eucalypticola]|uniref:Fic family protein n=1 Tax=Pseudomonas eucalypticola TaxID=2599595 RepID=A0A7D5D9T7_9PSED|nr:Fic family protein [Pseudomonas eucalypticola]QKZ06352.1 Fic family protein [Pseudomonas eucalypticola]
MKPPLCLSLDEAASHPAFLAAPAHYMALHAVVDDKGRYLHFDELRHRWPSTLVPILCWSMVKAARLSAQRALIPLGQPLQWGTWCATPQSHKAMALVDRHATRAAMEYITRQLGEAAHFNYLLNDLIEDEAISSSQLEGAATTTLVAKDLLKRQRQPRTPDERMILGNYRMMKFAWEQRHAPLSVKLIEEMHETGVTGIDDDKYTPGQFRNHDQVVVQDGEGNTVHVPPPAAGLEERLQRLVEWVNAAPENVEEQGYLHPLIRAISLHFAIGYEHPFRDGNGRVARALFYWLMFKSDYCVFRYIAISVLLKNAPVKYGRSYLHTETDDLDLTYFIEYQCGLIIRAVTQFTETYTRSLADAQAFEHWWVNSGVYVHLNEHQRALLQVARTGSAIAFTAVTAKENLGCSYNTASAALNGLVDLGLFVKVKRGREWVFSMADKSQIRQAWR